MADPVFATAQWDPSTLRLTITAVGNIGPGNQLGTAATIQLTDNQGNVFTNAAGAGANYTGVYISGSGSPTIILQLQAGGATAGTVSTVDIAGGCYNDTASGDPSAGDTNAAVYTTLNHAVPFTYNDVNNLAILTAAIANGDVDPESELPFADMANNTLLAKLLKAPRTEDRAYALIAQFVKYRESTKAPDDLQRLAAAIEELRASLNAPGTFQMLPNGT